jgi:hypothetical protein
MLILEEDNHIMCCQKFKPQYVVLSRVSMDVFGGLFLAGKQASGSGR